MRYYIYMNRTPSLNKEAQEDEVSDIEVQGDDSSFHNEPRPHSRRRRRLLLLLRGLHTSTGPSFSQSPNCPLTVLPPPARSSANTCVFTTR